MEKEIWRLICSNRRVPECMNQMNTQQSLDKKIKIWMSQKINILSIKMRGFFGGGVEVDQILLKFIWESLLQK